MIANPGHTSPSSRLRVLLCSFLFIVAGIAVIGAIGSSHGIGQGGSASPEEDGKGIAEGAKLGGKAALIRQRVEPPSHRYGVPRDNAFHLKIAAWVIQHTANGQQAEFFVVLVDQVDLSGATALGTKPEKGRYVYDALRNETQTTQKSILQWLREHGIE